MENQKDSLLKNLNECQACSLNNQKDINYINNENEISINKNKTFNKLRKLQKLIKKEAALKELCKKYNKFYYIYSYSDKR